jgi:iron complex outermembrane recepter protein
MTKTFTPYAGHISSEGEPMIQTHPRRGSTCVSTVAIVHVAVVCGGISSQAMSAESDTDAGDSVTEVIVTGSRIRGVAPVGSNLISVDQDNLIKVPATNTVDMLRRVPQISGYGSNEQMKFQSGPTGSGTNATRVETVNLRGVGASATLVLFDGLRVPAGGLGGTQVDVTSLPVSALERVEVVADGASAIYGSDAVAGVVNFVPKTRVDEWESRAQVGLADGFDTLSVSQTLGGDWGSGGWMAAVQHSENSHLNGRERDFYKSDLGALGGRDYRSTQCNPGTIIANGVSYAIPEGGVTPATANQLVPNTVNRCELYRTGDIIAQQRRESAYFNVDQNIGERFTVFLRGVGARREYEADDYSQGSTTQVTRLTVPASNAFFVRPPGSSGPVSVDYFYGPDQGTLEFAGDSSYYQLILGGTAQLWSDWQANWKTGWSRTEDELVAVNFLAAQQSAALASSDPNVALNPFGRNDPSKIGYIFTNLFNPFADYELLTNTLDASGSLFDLPGGAVRVALGVDYTDYTINTGNYRGDIAAPVYMLTPSDRQIRAAFGELFVPIFGDANGRAGLRSLELSLAGRLDDYSDVGRTSNPKIGINYSPIDSLAFKGSYGTSFKAPGTNNLAVDRPGSALIVFSATDPLSPTGTSIGLNINAGNPDLAPEEAETYSFSAQFKPESIPGLTLNATWFSIESTGGILSVPAQSALTNPLYAPFVTRNPTQAQVDAIVAAYPQLLVRSGTLNPLPAFVVDTRPLNSGGFQLEGIDFVGGFDVPSQYGDFYFGLNGTYNTDWEVRVTDDAPASKLLDRVNNPLRLRMRGELGWQLGGWSTDAILNYVNGYQNTQVSPTQKVDSYVTLDLRGAYRFGEQGNLFTRGLTLTVSVANALDEDPPFVDVESGIDAANASAIGRMIALTLQKNW